MARRTRSRSSCVLTFFVLLVSAQKAADADPYYPQVTLLPPNAEAQGMNNSGDIVGYYAGHNGGAGEAFLYRNGVTTDLGINGFALAINDKGEIAGANFGSSVLHDGSAGPSIYLPGSFTLGNTVGLNDSGQVVGAMNARDTSLPHAFLFSAGVVTDIGQLLGWTKGTQGVAINNSGQVLVSSVIRAGREAISVVMHTDRPGIWQDSRTLLEHGFEKLGAPPQQPEAAPASGAEKPPSALGSDGR